MPESDVAERPFKEACCLCGKEVAGRRVPAAEAGAIAQEDLAGYLCVSCGMTYLPELRPQARVPHSRPLRLQELRRQREGGRLRGGQPAAAAAGPRHGDGGGGQRVRRGHARGAGAGQPVRRPPAPDQAGGRRRTAHVHRDRAGQCERGETAPAVRQAQEGLAGGLCGQAQRAARPAGRQSRGDLRPRRHAGLRVHRRASAGGIGRARIAPGCPAPATAPAGAASPAARSGRRPEPTWR